MHFLIKYLKGFFIKFVDVPTSINSVDRIIGTALVPLMEKFGTLA